MSRGQFAFIVGVLLVWFAWAAGWIVLAGIAAGLIGWGIVRVLEGGVDLGEVSERFRSTAGRPRADPAAPIQRPRAHAPFVFPRFSTP